MMSYSEQSYDSVQKSATWHDLGPVADFPPGSQTCTTVAGREVVVIHEDGQWFVFANYCPHAGLPIGEGEHRGCVIVCPFHGYTYNIKNGRNVDWPEDEPPLKMFPTRVENDTLQMLAAPK